ncbi:origin recognition complex subunit 4 C-terminus-domain-containing protein [Piptocephalis cylindrospora]|uniref:Origin recognition complex subunit 4 n=1 Tax=Piptocephalis cylindrospora TaxID=1907219 RepID=A0A4P9Y8F7_9FUNG|nr:origin recognition complex subunit 4 C-terminus-domain-containing protein [Piptocephalis cylindrospora]|eukprot:RKP14270.1 origin recognition complex subunit 4 C-terminus-domain-containing protein [Piptocephalis cylindrospora]
MTVSEENLPPSPRQGKKRRLSKELPIAETTGEAIVEEDVYESIPVVSGVEWTQEQLQGLKARILPRLTGREPPEKLLALEEAEHRVYAFLENAVQTGEGGSALILGPSGSGKSMLTERALGRLKESQTPSSYLVVRLSGLAQPTDRSALVELARQVAPHLPQDSSMNPSQGFRSFADALAHLLHLLGSGSAQTTTPLLIILDHFDLFASRPRQTLLYGLLDAAVSGQTPVIVLGLTGRVDAVDMMEKRVKSRFSHRVIRLTRVPRFDDFYQVARDVLQPPEDLLGLLSPAHLEAFTQATEQLLTDPEVEAEIRRIFDLAKDPLRLNRVLIEPVIGLTPTSPYLLPQAVVQAAIRQTLTGLEDIPSQANSLLELCLIIAAKRFLEREEETFTFEQLYDEYLTFATTGGVKVWRKPVALKGFERLLASEMFLVSGGRGSSMSGLKGFWKVRISLDAQGISHLVDRFPRCPAPVKSWGQKWVQ